MIAINGSDVFCSESLVRPNACSLRELENMLSRLPLVLAALAGVAIGQTTTYQAEVASATGVTVGTSVTGYTGWYFLTLRRENTC